MGRGADVVLSPVEYETVRQALVEAAGALRDVAGVGPEPVAGAAVLAELVGEAVDVLRAARDRAERSA